MGRLTARKVTILRKAVGPIADIKNESNSIDADRPERLLIHSRKRTNIQGPVVKAIRMPYRPDENQKAFVFSIGRGKKHNDNSDGQLPTVGSKTTEEKIPVEEIKGDDKKETVLEGDKN